MVQTFQGYFLDGRFITPQAMTIPEHVEVYVVVTGKPMPAKKTKVQKQRQAFEDFVLAIDNAEPLCETFDEIISQGINLRRELDV